MSMLRSFVVICLLILGWTAVPAQYAPPSQSAKAVAGIDFSKAVAIDEAYRKTFEDCDKNGKCKTDPNNFRAFLKFADGSVFYESKMSLDLDGSWKACGCGTPGKSDQCRTTHLWNDAYPSDKEYFAEKDKCRCGEFSVHGHPIRFEIRRFDGFVGGRSGSCDI